MLGTSMDHITSGPNEYGEHNFGEGFNTSDWSEIPNLMGIASSFGVPMQSLHANNPSSVFQDASSSMDFSSMSDMPPSTMSMAMSMAPSPMAMAMSMPPSSMSMSVPHSAPGLATTSPQDFGNPMTSAFFMPTTPLVSTAPIVSPSTPTFAPLNGMRRDSRTTPPMHQHSPDVLEAATVLQGGSHNRSHSIHNIPQQRPTNQGMGPPVGHLRHQDMSDFRQERRRMSESLGPHVVDTFVKWAFPNRSLANSPRQPRVSAPVNLQYGSDVRFNGNQPFLPESEKESFEGLALEQNRYLKAVRLSNSPDSTQHTSPEPDATRGPFLRTTGRPNSLSINTRINSLSVETGMNGRAKRPSIDDDEAQSALVRNMARKRKSAQRASTESPREEGNEGKKKRRKSAGAAKKENLTEKQKRENHIKSERKRRGVIDVGFKNLNRMVPALVGQNPSKAATLTSAHEFFIEITVGNVELANLLRQM